MFGVLSAVKRHACLRTHPTAKGFIGCLPRYWRSPFFMVPSFMACVSKLVV